MTDFDYFKKMVIANNKEYQETDGKVNCEFSSSEEQLAEKMEFVAKNCPSNGYWHVQWCETCHEQHEGWNDFHFELKAN